MWRDALTPKYIQRFRLTRSCSWSGSVQVSNTLCNILQSFPASLNLMSRSLMTHSFNVLWYAQPLWQ